MAKIGDFALRKKSEGKNANGGYGSKILSSSNMDTEDVTKR